MATVTGSTFPGGGKKEDFYPTWYNIQETFVLVDVRNGNRNELLAIKCCLSWSILGGSSNVQSHSPVQVDLISCEDLSLSNQLEEFWGSESYGTTRPETKPKNERLKSLKAY